jgi:urease accessory protein
MSSTYRPRTVARVSIEQNRARRSVARETYAEAPLRLLRPRNGGHAVWIFSTMLGPGFLGGDDAAMELTVGEGAICYAGSIGLARAFAGAARVQQRLRVEDGGLLVWAPDPLACGRGADLVAETEVELAPGASLLLVDAISAGRPALGERWCFRRLRSSLRVRSGGQERLREQIDLRPEELPVARHFGAVDAFGLLCALGPRARSTRASWLAGGPRTGPELTIHGAPLGDDGGVLRMAATGATSLLSAALTSLGDLTALLGDDPRTCRF